MQAHTKSCNDLHKYINIGPYLKHEFQNEKDNHYKLTLIGLRGDTFISLSFLDQILSADSLPKLSNPFEGEN